MINLIDKTQRGKEREIICVVLILFLNFCFGCIAYADELSELKDQLKAMQEQMQI